MLPEQLAASSLGEEFLAQDRGGGHAKSDTDSSWLNWIWQSHVVYITRKSEMFGL